MEGSGNRPRSGRSNRRRRKPPGGGQGQGQGGNRSRGRSRHGRQGNRGGANGPGRAGGGPLVETAPEGEASVDAGGVLLLLGPGHGVLRSPQRDFGPESEDPVVPRDLIRKLELEPGVELTGMAVPSERPGRPPCLSEIRTINGAEPQAWPPKARFKDLVAEDPVERIRLESDPAEISTRVVDLIAPIGKGQRCLIVAPPKAGKTVLLQKIAHSVTTNHPEIHLIVLLVDERPEEVTDMRRNVQGEVIASSADEMTRNHVEIAEVVLERSRRLVESGRDVVVLLDSITRLSRAYNSQQKGSGRVLSGGIDARTMEKPRRFFGAARNVVDGGSLTVIGTALVDTGSRMDEVIFQEFKGTGNTEIVMDRGLFDRRIFPAIDISATGTRKEEKLFSAEEYQKVTLLRRALAPLKAAEAMQLLTERLAKYPDNASFLRDLTK
jgi:transcription termination factor Rho